MQDNTYIIVTPVYNDWACLLELCADIDRVFAAVNLQYHIVAVNDGSTLQKEAFGINNFDSRDPSNSHLTIIDLQRNLGHQKAIATGISYVSKKMDPDFVIVMDSDGEDRPADIPQLIEAHRNSEDRIIFARRKSRQESSLFKFMYRWYKLAFKLLTGYVITFGNFVLIPKEKLSRLIYISEIWNHFPGGIIRSKLPFTSVPIDRGKRYTGQSKMNMISLVQHGISSITVNIDIVSVRLLVFSVLLIMVILVALFGLIYIRFFSDFVIPGWTSTVAIGLLVIMLQAFFFSLLLTFTVLNGRVQKNFIPALDYEDYIRDVKKATIHGAD